MLPLKIIAALVVLTVSGCGPAPIGSELFEDPAEPLPAYAKATIPTLEETGLYSDFAARTVTEGLQLFKPRFPLYSDGAAKKRYISLPAGTAIDPASMERWQFPVGTRIWKEFRGGTPPRMIETRYMEKREGQWLFAVYVWNAEQTSATLWAGNAIPNAATMSVQTANGMQNVPYEIPSFDQCVTCHKQHGNTTTNLPEPVLGFSAFQLERQTIEEMMTSGALTQATVNWAAHAIPTQDMREKGVIGYLHGNCGHCHTRKRPEMAPMTGGVPFALDYNLGSVNGRATVNLIRLIGKPIINAAVVIPLGDQPKLIKAGKAKDSMLHFRMSEAVVPHMMPRVGTTSRDHSFVTTKLKPWLDGLPNLP